MVSEKGDVSAGAGPARRMPIAHGSSVMVVWWKWVWDRTVGEVGRSVEATLWVEVAPPRTVTSPPRVLTSPARVLPHVSPPSVPSSAPETLLALGMRYIIGNIT